MSTDADKIKEFIAETLSIDQAKVVEQASFFGDLGADSLSIVELVMGLESEFGIDIPDDEAQKIITVQDAITYVQTAQAQA